MLLPGRAVQGRRTTFVVLLLGFLGGCGSSDPQIPATLTLSTNSVSFASLGQTQQLSPIVVDQDGRPISGVSVSWSSSNGQVASVTQAGLVRAEGGGTATITATAGSASGTAQVSVTQTPAQIQKISGDGQTAPADQTLTSPLVVQVNDPGGSPVAGANVTFAVADGDGSVGPPTATTGSNGRASTTYTIGTSAGSAQTVTATVPTTTLTVSFTAVAEADPASFNIGLRYLSSATTSQRQAFNDARIRWEGAITSDLEDGQLQAAAGTCGPGSPAINQSIDDVVILVNVVPIDGPGNVLGVAGPCYVRDFPPTPSLEPGDLTILGLMRFDEADLAEIEADGFLSSVILHEMGHVLGFGTLWPDHNFLTDPSLPDDDDNPATPHRDPHFTGTQAEVAFDNVGGTTYVLGQKVPVENTGGVGTADGHWRENPFDNELMTGFIVPGLNPLSSVTLASLSDQGYGVNLAAADPYNLLLSLRASSNRRKLHLKDDIFRGPVRMVDPKGRVTGILRR